MSKNPYKKLKKILGLDLKENIILKDYTTMKVGGPAKYFYIANRIEDLIKAVMTAKQEMIPLEILGGGSNVIIDDKGFNGLVIINKSKNISFINDKAQIIADSGVSLARLIIDAANHDLGGLEPLYGIPGTLGGAIYGNAGAGGIEICSFVKNLTLLNPDNKIIRVKNSWLEAGYRITRIKKLKKQKKPVPVILTALIQMSHHKKDEIIRKIQYFKNVRLKKQPYDLPSAGSIFKNLGLEKEKTAGYILEAVGAKKLKEGGAGVSKKHANFIVNNGNANSENVKNLIIKMKQLAHDRYGVELEEEVEYIEYI